MLQLALLVFYIGQIAAIIILIIELIVLCNNVSGSAPDKSRLPSQDYAFEGGKLGISSPILLELLILAQAHLPILWPPQRNELWHLPPLVEMSTSWLSGVTHADTAPMMSLTAGEPAYATARSTR